jgi:CubicO group peptidase (beta-lactamase class C family)
VKRKSAILSLAILLITSCSQKHSNNILSAYDSLLLPQFQSNGPGAVALVVRHGVVLHRKAYGMASIELAVPMDTTNLFRIGSITKQFTACAILKLAEEGKLSLKDEITKFIPDYPTHGFHITIEHLLTHTSGIRSYTGMKEWTEEFQKKNITPLSLIKWFRDQPIDFAPGEEFRYNNSAYCILGFIIEKVSGKSYSNYLNDEIFVPLGLRRTFYDSTQVIIPNRASGYQKTKRNIENAAYLNMSQPYSAGALLSNAGDLYKWTKAIMNGKLISKEMLSRAHTPYKLNNGKPVNYGYGWFLLNIKGVPSIEHGGGINGFSTCCLYVPSMDVFVALLANCTSSDVGDLAVKLASLAMNNPYNNRMIKLPADSLEQYKGVYESKEKDEAIIRIKDSCLYGWIKGSKRLKFTSSAKDRFFVEGSFTSFEFSRNSKNEIDSLFSFDRAAIIHWEKTTKPLPDEKYVQLQESVLIKYIGEYKLFSNFNISIHMRDKKLYAEGTDQPEFEIYARSKNSFVTEDGDIQFEFLKNSSGNFNKIKVYQGDRVMQGERIK